MLKWVMWPKFSIAFTILLGLAIISGNAGPMSQVARILGSAATFTEAASSAAGSAINSTSTLVATASEMAVAVAVNSMSVGSNLWHGTDIFNVSAKRCSGQIYVDSAAVLEEWLCTNNAKILLPCVDQWLSTALVASAASISFHCFCSVLLQRPFHFIVHHTVG